MRIYDDIDLEVVDLVNGYARTEDASHDDEAMRVGIVDLDAVHAEVLRQQRVRVALYHVLQACATHCTHVPHITLCGTLPHTAHMCHTSILCGTLSHTANVCHTVRHSTTYCTHVPHCVTLNHTPNTCATLCDTQPHTKHMRYT